MTNRIYTQNTPQPYTTFYDEMASIENKKNDTIDIDIDVVYNGYLVDVGDKKYVFPDFATLTEWLEKNFKTPKKARETINNMKKPGIGKRLGQLDSYRDGWKKSPDHYNTFNIPTEQYITTAGSGAFDPNLPISTTSDGA